MRGKVAKQMRRWTRLWLSHTSSTVSFRAAYKELKKRYKERKHVV